MNTKQFHSLLHSERRAPQLGQLITSACGCSKSSEIGTPRAAASFVMLSRVGLHDNIRYKLSLLSPIFFATSVFDSWFLFRILSMFIISTQLFFCKGINNICIDNKKHYDNTFIDELTKFNRNNLQYICQYKYYHLSLQCEY
jgi:hypothetical protein